MNGGTSRHRLGLVAIMALSLFGALFARLWFLQVVEGSTYEEQATANQTRTVITPAPRGRILDRNGIALVDNRESITVAVDSQAYAKLEKPDQKRLLERLSTALNRNMAPGQQPSTVESLELRLNDARFSPFRPIPVAEDITQDQEIFFSEQADRFPAVVVERQTVRSYPYGSLAAHVLGYVGALNETEYAALKDDADKPYEKSDEIGKSGVEAAYETYLRGTPGQRVYEVDRSNRVIRERESDYQAPKAGDDVFLSIDVRVQAETEISLRQGLEQRRQQPGELGMFPSEAGAASVVDPHNGQVRAMASFPTYDPSTLVGGIDCPVWRDLQGLPAAGKCKDIDKEIAAIPAADRPVSKLVNRGIAGLYPPGSTFKLATAYAGLKLGLITPDTTIYDPGYFLIPGCKGTTGCRVSSPSAESGGIGNVNLNGAMTASSDTYFYKLGNDTWALHKQQGRVGPTALQDEIEKFGFGSQTGIELAGEKAGRVPDPTWLKEFDKNLNGSSTDAGVWQSGASINLAIGQGDVLVTPLQMANAYASFANGGTLYRPSVLDHISTTSVDPDVPAKVVKTFEPKVIRKMDWDPTAFAAMKDGLEGVTQPRDHATAAAAFEGFPQEIWRAAGKTGTAQTGTKTARKEDHSWFVGFGPAADPTYSAAVIMEHSGGGGAAAAPAVRRIFEIVAANQLDLVDLRSLIDPNGVVPSTGAAASTDAGPDGEVSAGAGTTPVTTPGSTPGTTTETTAPAATGTAGREN